ncbi:MAG: V-type ATP synthase subunit F [Wenzhouxiangella sp.]|jgi:vacuolar-type H+-ATPase subunit F/Vma7|nr:V-type ATP synthase subunit F [Wenzhouxiangella sp.]
MYPPNGNGPIVISDRLTAAGFRLAGLETAIASAEDVANQVRAAVRRQQPVLLTADLAAHMSDEELAAIIRHARPPLAIIPDVSGHGESPELASRVKRALGVET